MAKPEWGIKRICPSCGTRYYDMRKDPPTCPSCGTVFDPEALLKSRRARPIPVEEPKRAAVEAEEGEELETADDAAETDEALDDDEAADDDLPVAGEEADEEADEEKDVLIEDTSELGEDDDVGEVVDIEDGEEER